MADTEGLSLDRQRLLLDLDTISVINNALKLLDYDASQPLDRVHGNISIKVVRGEISYIEATHSLPAQRIQRRKKTA